MQSQSPENINLNDNEQIIQFEPVVEYKMYDLPVDDLTVCDLTAVNLTSDIVAEPPVAPTNAVARKKPARHYFKWNYHEINQLHREVELNNYTIQEIATRHQRTNSSILFKLREEKIIQWDCSLDNTNMRTVLEYYNNYLRNYSVIEEEEDEDYVPTDGSDEEEEEEDEDETEDPCTFHIALLKYNRYKPDIFDKMLFAYLDTIYLTIQAASNVISSVYNAIFRR